MLCKNEKISYVYARSMNGHICHKYVDEIVWRSIDAITKPKERTNAGEKRAASRKKHTNRQNDPAHSENVHDDANNVKKRKIIN